MYKICDTIFALSRFVPRFRSAVRRDAKIPVQMLSDRDLHRIFQSIDIDCSGEVEVDELASFMLPGSAMAIAPKGASEATATELPPAYKGRFTDEVRTSWHGMWEWEQSRSSRSLTSSPHFARCCAAGPCDKPPAVQGMGGAVLHQYWSCHELVVL
jgi:hypothetical protein